MESFEKAEADDSVNVIMLQSNGQPFCSGYDNKALYYFHSSRKCNIELGLAGTMKNLHKETLNTDLKIKGLAALFKYYV